MEVRFAEINKCAEGAHIISEPAGERITFFYQPIHLLYFEFVYWYFICLNRQINIE